MRRASNIAAALAIALVVIGIGGVHTVVVAGAALLALVAASLKIAHLRAREHRVVVSLVGLAFGSAAALCMVQIAPVPDFVHTVLNPIGLDLFESGAELAGVDADRWRPLSLDPAQTADRAMRYIALTAIAVWAANVRGRRRWQRFAYGFVTLALVDLAVGYVLWVSKATSFFGLYEPTVGGFRGQSTFISTNHGAVFFGLAALVAAAAAFGLRRDRPKRAAVFGAAVVVLLIATIAQNSDGVLLALGAAAAAGALVQWLRRGKPTDLRPDLAIGVGLLSLLSVIAAVWLDLHRLAFGFFERVLLSGEHGGRLEVMLAGFSALDDFWRFGAGAGSVETVIPAYIDWSKIVAASVPVVENDALETLLSFGIPIGLLLLLAPIAQVALLLGRGADGHRSPRYAVAIVGAVYFLVVGQLHFPLFALGIALPAVAWFELLWSRRNRPSRGGRVFPTGHIALSPRAALIGVAAFGAALVLAGQAHYDGYAPAQQLADQEEIEREVWLRPASHVPYVKLATARATGGDSAQALALADHAVEREPSARVRLYRAQVLALVDVDAAVDRYRELFDEGHTGRRFVRVFLTSVTDARKRAEMLQEHPALWEHATKRIRAIDGPDGASSFVVELVTLRPDDPNAYRVASTTYLALGQPVLAELWAELASDMERTKNTESIEGPLLLARALRASGRVEEARQVLEEASDDPRLVRRAHHEALKLRGKPDRANYDFVKRHYDAFCGSPVPPEDRRICWTAEGWLLETTGEHSGAVQVYRRLRRQLDDPLPLAEYLLRAGHCEDLATLSRELEPGAKRSTAKAFADRCRPR